MGGALASQTVTRAPRSQVELGNASVLAVALPQLSVTRQRKVHPKHSFEDKGVPKYNLGTRNEWKDLGKELFDPGSGEVTGRKRCD